MSEKVDDHELFDSEVIFEKKRTFIVFLTVFTFLLFALGVMLFLIYAQPPLMPQNGIAFEVERGMTVQDITQSAQKQGIVRSSFLLYSILNYFYDPTTIYAGTYIFSKPVSVFDVAKKLARNDVDKTLLSITIPEGSTRKQIALYAEKKLKDFNRDTFLNITKDSEGYLFPDTYYVTGDYTANDFKNVLTETFQKKLLPYKEAIASSSLSEKDVIILASILEREANDEQSMKIVSGILQNRLKHGMALQVDASIEYVLDKSLSELTSEDLKIDSPYNTYLHTGLTPTPIGNPGLQAIDAVLHPAQTEYLYYITDADGHFHYAKTFEEHKRNVTKYLQ
mgnify:CR=1 FL=1